MGFDFRYVGFDQTSLGWLVKIFIRHHPEIDWGVHAGSTMSISSSVRKAAEDGLDVRVCLPVA